MPEQKVKSTLAWLGKPEPYEHLDRRPVKEGEEFNQEAGYIVFDDGDLNRRPNIEALGEVLGRMGIKITEIDAGWSDLVLHFEKK